jgi:DNA-binding MarR family transcriptional regulator
MKPLDHRLSLLYEVHRVSRLAHELVEGALEDQELNGSEFAMYSYLAATGPQTISEVAAGIAAPIPAASKLLGRAEERGHLTRSDHPSDGRSTLVDLNDAGRAAHAAARPAFGRALAALHTSIGSSMDDLRWALNRLDHGLAAALGEPTGGEAPRRPNTRSLEFDGPPLTAAEENEVRRYIDWLRWQRDA